MAYCRLGHVKRRGRQGRAGAAGAAGGREGRATSGSERLLSAAWSQQHRIGRGERRERVGDRGAGFGKDHGAAVRLPEDASGQWLGRRDWPLLVGEEGAMHAPAGLPSCPSAP